MGKRRRRGQKSQAQPKPRSWLRRLLRLSVQLTALLMLLSIALVVSLRWVNPPITGVMLQRKVEAAMAGQPTVSERRWCSLAELGSELPRAVLAAEDQRFFDHHGFDFTEIGIAIEQAQQGEGLRGASTISQQVAKNVFLTTHRSWLRKGLELWFTVLIEATWSKQRILEVYMNVAEWGPSLFGGCAAAQRYFSRQPADLDRRQAAQLAVVLPAPRRRRPDQLTDYSASRVDWVIGQMNNVRLRFED